MLGGQLGFRLSKQTGHWLLSTEFRAFALQNWQILRGRADQTETRYDGKATATTPPTVEVVLQSVTLSNNHNAEFAWGGEIRTEAAYELTRDISLRGGFVMLDLGKGIGRGLTLTHSNQDVMMVGVTLGLTVNR